MTSFFTNHGGALRHDRRRGRSDATAAGRTEEASRITVAGAVRWNGDRARPRRLGCFENGQRAAGTRRVREREHDRSRAGTGGTSLTPICRTNAAANDRPCTPVPSPNFHGKEGVDGSSPSEGSAKAPQNEVFCIRAGLHSPRSLG